MSPDPFGVDDGTAGAPPPPSVMEVANALASEVEQTAAEAEQAAQEVAAEVSADIGPAYSDAYLQVSLIVGTVDNALTAALAPLDQTLNAIVGPVDAALYEAETAIFDSGISPATTTTQQEVELADPTGEALVNRILEGNPELFATPDEVTDANPLDPPADQPAEEPPPPGGIPDPPLPEPEPPPPPVPPAPEPGSFLPGDEVPNVPTGEQAEPPPVVPPPYPPPGAVDYSLPYGPGYDCPAEVRDLPELTIISELPPFGVRNFLVVPPVLADDTGAGVVWQYGWPVPADLSPTGLMVGGLEAPPLNRVPGDFLYFSFFSPPPGDPERRSSHAVWACTRYTANGPQGSSPPPVSPPPVVPPPPVSPPPVSPPVSPPPVSPPPTVPPVSPPPPAGVVPYDGPSPAGIYWGDADACAKAQTIVDKGNGEVNPVGSDFGTGPGFGWADVVEIGTSPGLYVARGVLDGLNAIKDTIFSDPPTSKAEATKQVIGSGLVQTVLRELLPIETPNIGAAMYMLPRIASAKMAERLTGVPVDWLAQQWVYTLQYACPQLIPSQPEVDAMYLGNRITIGVWECLTRANGNIPELFSKALETKSTRAGVSELVALFNRGIFTSEDAFLKRMRELGVVEDGRAAEFVELSKQVPTFADIVRLMVRDAADDSVAALYQYDKDFTDKFKGDLVKWARINGITPDIAKLSWRAHWEIPSYTQLSEMVHRFSPDRPEVVAHLNAQPEQSTQNPLGPGWTGPPVVTLEAAREALEINDMAPAWVGPLIGISYSPITRTDATRAYNVGFFDKTKLYWSYRAVGYNADDAQTLADFAETEKAKRVSNVSGVWTVRKVISRFKAGAITRPVAQALLTPSIPDEPTRTRILDGAEGEADADSKLAQIKSIKRAYMYGVMDAEALDNSLSLLGLEVWQRQTYARQWTAERDGRLKEPRVAQLCQWFTHNLINQNEYFTRLMRLGYTADDAAKIASVCSSDNTARLSKQAAVAAEKARKEQERVLKDFLKALDEERKEIQAEVDRLKKQQKELEEQIKQQQEAAGQTGGGS